MKNKVFIRVFAVVALLAFLTVSIIAMLPSGANAVSISEAQQQQEDAKKKGDEAREAQQAEIQRREEIDAQITEVEAKILAYEIEINEKVKKIDETTAQIEKLTCDLVEQNTAYTERAKALIKKGDVSYVEILLKAKSVEDLLTRIAVLKQVAKYDSEQIAKIEKSMKEVEALKETLLEEKEAVILLKEEQDAQKATLEELRAESQQIIDELQEDIDAFDAQYEAAKKAEEEARAAAQQAANSGNYDIPANFVGGQFLWPSATTIITSPYGYRIHPVTGKQRFHSGVDIGASYGTNIFAANSGTVVVSGYNSGGYGNYVVINHGGGYSTLYAHCSSLLVSAGQQVSQGQVIATCGSTGMSTGPHIHFEIQLNGQTTNPLQYFQ